MIIGIDYLDEIGIEKKRRHIGRDMPDPHAVVLWDRAISLIECDNKKEKLIEAYNFAKSIKYRHIGLSSEIYFAHPVRVAALALLSQKDKSIDLGIIGLLHNIFELSDTKIGVIGDIFGCSVESQIIDLTVDRNLQWDHNYKKSYYSKINTNPIDCRIVKIFDKLDNIFLLDQNPDSSVKQRYIEEIKKYIIPMCEKDIPELSDYMKNMIKNYFKININL